MSYEEEGNVASRQFSRENILKAFVVLEAQKDISKKHALICLGCHRVLCTLQCMKKCFPPVIIMQVVERLYRAFT